MSKTPNPWTTIPAADYEGHMNSPSVNQLSFICDCFRDALSAHTPTDVAVIGCGTGNGLAHIDPAMTKRTTVIDINTGFLEVLRSRYADKISGLDVRCEDLVECDLPQNSYQLVFAGLVFEFLDADALLNKVSGWLAKGGALKVILQLPNEALPTVSNSGYDSLRRINPIANLVDVPKFCHTCQKLNLEQVESNTVTLPSGKSFFVGTFKK